MIETICNRILSGGQITPEEAYTITDAISQDTTGTKRNQLYVAAEKITHHFGKPQFESCSIVNARSGRCPENCKWCAQSAHFKTSCEVYDLIDENECLEVARHNAINGVHRFSMVTSGKMAGKGIIDNVCSMLRKVKEKTGIKVCASLGLITETQMRKLRDCGVDRYHCNLETAPSHFKKLCTTHTIEDKLNTIRIAHELGLQVCSGGIIGMGETQRQRTEFALALLQAKPVSIPINILCPIPGTPLENMESITEQEILDTVAIMRLIHPTVEMRFAGGRHKMSRETQLKAMKLGINAGITGDLLTTTGSTIASDKQLVKEAGMEF